MWETHLGKSSCFRLKSSWSEREFNCCAQGLHGIIQGAGADFAQGGTEMGQKEMGTSSNERNWLCIKEKVLQGIKGQRISCVLICRNLLLPKLKKTQGQHTFKRNSLTKES